jgi:hypothetical protein
MHHHALLGKPTGRNPPSFTGSFYHDGPKMKQGKIKKENIIQKSKKKFEKTKKQFKISLFSEQHSKNCGISDGCSLAYPAGMS